MKNDNEKSSLSIIKNMATLLSGLHVKKGYY